MPSKNTTAELHNPHRRSTEDTSHLRKTISGESDTLLLDPEDFNDVFGGPPRTVIMLQQFSRPSFYEKIFREPEEVGPEGTVPRSGRVLPEFDIPAGRVGRKSDQRFFNYIFGWGKEEVRRLRTRSGSGSKSKGSSSSVLSSEDLSSLQTAVGGGRHGGDDEVSLFASTLRPINVPSRWNSGRMEQEEHQRQHDMLEFLWKNPSYQAENDCNENFRSSHFGYCPRNSSPETISLDPNPYCSLKLSADDLELNSSLGAVSSVCQDQEAMASKAKDEIMQEQGVEEEEDEVMSSYVIEIDSGNREGTDDAIGVEEAIAWAKEKYQKYCSENMWSMKLDEEKQSAEAEEMVNGDETLEGQKIDEPGSTEAAVNWKADVCTTEEETGQMERDMEMDLLDENVRLWSTGKEADIRLLLSTLHHILWPYSGWSEIPLTSLMESSQLKKAYQRARLCLHPDKLQQRGATLPQKHVAEKAFLILQEAWAALISQDVS